MFEAVLTARQTDLTVLSDVADDSQGGLLHLLGPNAFTNVSHIHSSTSSLPGDTKNVPFKWQRSRPVFTMYLVALSYSLEFP